MTTNLRDNLLQTLRRHAELKISESVDYQKFYIYSLITHSTAIEGSTITELENQLLFDEGITSHGKSLVEQMMNVDLKAAYERGWQMADDHTDYSVEMLKALSAMAMRNTGSVYNTPQDNFDSSAGNLRLVNVAAGGGGRSYLSHLKIHKALTDFCEQLNAARLRAKNQDIWEQYILSIDTHFQLVNIHPWVDGNGRMARLVMNILQAEMGLPPIKVTKEHRSEYIAALANAQIQELPEMFREFMIEEHISNLQAEIDRFCHDINSDSPRPLF